jgi:hypothetical protein
MKKTLLVLLGYGIGLGGLVLITYRTLLAVGTESKAITISVNRFGEQYVDLACLVFLWGVCVVGLLSLSSLLKEEKIEKASDRNKSERNVVKKPGLSLDVVPDSFLDEPSRVVVGAFGESFSETGSGFYHRDDEGTCCVFSYSVRVIQDYTEE